MTYSTSYPNVIISAAIAMAGIAGDVNRSRDHLDRRLAAMCKRAGLRSTAASQWRSRSSFRG